MQVSDRFTFQNSEFFLLRMETNDDMFSPKTKPVAKESKSKNENVFLPGEEPTDDPLWAEDEELTHDEIPFWCSWCFNHTSHRLIVKRRFLRNVYQCNHCFGMTQHCRLCKKAMAKKFPNYDEKFCAKCDKSVSYVEVIEVGKCWLKRGKKLTDFIKTFINNLDRFH